MVLLNCLVDQAHVILEQADELGMLDADWAWLLTDGSTALVCMNSVQAMFKGEDFRYQDNESHLIQYTEINLLAKNVTCCPPSINGS